MQLDDPHSEGEQDPQEEYLEGLIHAMLGKFSFYEDHDKSIYTCIKRRGKKSHVPVLSQPFRFLLQSLAAVNQIELTDEEAYEQCRKIARLLQNPDNDYNLSEGTHKYLAIRDDEESQLFFKLDSLRSRLFKG
jgi:hypothetical protein